LNQVRVSDAHPEWFTQEHADPLFCIDQEEPGMLRVPYWRYADSKGARHMTPDRLDQEDRERLSHFP